jgi:NitT/TauT family transport system substrate-binding protein
MTVPVIALSMAPVYLAKARGFFTEEGLEVEVTATGGGGPDVMALIAEDADFTFTSGDIGVMAFQGGKRLRLVMTAFHRPLINWAIHKDVARARGITEAMPLAEKVKALKGMNVGVTQVSSLTSHLATFVVRRAGFVPHQDVKIVAIGAGPTWVAALENRKVDVALMAPPLPDIAIGRGFAVSFIDNIRGEDPGLPEFLMEGLVTRPEVAEKSPELVRKMVRALLRANQWALASTPDEVTTALQPFLGNTDRALLLAGVQSSLPVFSPDGQTSERLLKTTQEVLLQAGILKAPIPYAEFVTNEFLPR